MLNITIARYANSTVQDLDCGEIKFESADLGLSETYTLDRDSKVSGKLVLHKATYKTISEKFLDGKLAPIQIVQIREPCWIGLAPSSALVVSMVMALKERFSLGIDPYETAQLCYEIEREVAGLAGGKQDQHGHVRGA